MWRYFKLIHVFIALQCCLTSLGVGVKLRAKPGTIAERVSDTTDVLLKALPNVSLRTSLEDLKLSEDCRSSVEHCVAQPQRKNCKEDILECAKSSLLGSTTTLHYADLAPDLSLPDLLAEVAPEVRLSDADTVAKKILSHCLSVKGSPWKTLLEKITGETSKAFPEAHKFVCGALMGEDQGTFPDVASAPSECNYAVARTICNRQVSSPSVGTLFVKWYPQLGSQQSGDVKTLSECWEKNERGLCLGALLLGKVCDTACATATCVFNRFQQAKNTLCLQKLTPNIQLFGLGAANQCQRLAKALGAPEPMTTCTMPSINP